jgi:hypothetical protein
MCYELTKDKFTFLGFFVQFNPIQLFFIHFTCYACYVSIDRKVKRGMMTKREDLEPLCTCTNRLSKYGVDSFNYSILNKRLTLLSPALGSIVICEWSQLAIVCL